MREKLLKPDERVFVTSGGLDRPRRGRITRLSSERDGYMVLLDGYRREREFALHVVEPLNVIDRLAELGR